MNDLQYHEKMQRGTPDFPIELYVIDSSHPRYRMQMHWHDEPEIIRVTRGRLTLRLDGSELTLGENRSVFIGGGVLHSAEPTDCNYECLVFAPELISNAVCMALMKKHIAKHTAENSKNINKLFTCMKSREYGYELETVGRLCLAAADIVRKGEGVTTAQNQKANKIKSAMRLIENSYASKITLDDMAKACRLSPNYFCRYFREIVGQTPFEYLTEYRIETACEMLLGGSASVTEVCLSCGFNDLSYFIHIFKKYKGMSPRTYIKSHE